MLKKTKYVALLLALLVHVMPHNFMYAQQKLSDLDFKSGSVLPFFTLHGTKYALLSREAAGKSKGTYDDFGGSRDPGEDPETTAAREFFEEAMVWGCIGLDLAATKDFITVDKGNTEFVVVFDHNVAYIVDFNLYKNKFFDNFYKVRIKMRKVFAHLKRQRNLTMNPTQKKNLERKIKKCWAVLEKDRLAMVKWDTLQAIIARSRESTGITVSAAVLSPRDRKWYEENITLRPYFVKKLRPFFMDKKYEVGENQKIRFYSMKSESSWWQSFLKWLKSYQPRFN